MNYSETLSRFECDQDALEAIDADPLNTPPAHPVHDEYPAAPGKDGE